MEYVESIGINTTRNAGVHVENTYNGDRYIVIEIRPQSRVVSIKVREDILMKFDSFVRKYELGSRSGVMKKFMEAFIQAVERIEGEKISSIELGINYVDEDGCEKTVKALIKI